MEIQNRAAEGNIIDDQFETMMLFFTGILLMTVILPVVQRGVSPTALATTDTAEPAQLPPPMALAGKFTNLGLNASPIEFGIGRYDFLENSPHTALGGVFLINDGPDSVFIAINDPNSVVEIAPSETRTIRMQDSGVWITSVYYYTRSGESAYVRLNGAY
jgi:hypothetical protein